MGERHNFERRHPKVRVAHRVGGVPAIPRGWMDSGQGYPIYPHIPRFTDMGIYGRGTRHISIDLSIDQSIRIDICLSIESIYIILSILLYMHTYIHM